MQDITLGTIYEDVAELQAQVAELQEQVANMQYVNTVTGQAVATREKLNGKVVYCKTIDVGALPNATDKTVATGLNMSEITVVKIEGIARNANGTTIPLPNATQSTTYLVGCFVTAGGNIMIGATTDRSDYTGTVKVYYTYNV